MDTSEKTLPEQTEAQARDYFRQGLNCAESTFLAFLSNHDTGVSPEMVRLASGFGGGIGHIMEPPRDTIPVTRFSVIGTWRQRNPA